MLKIKNLYMQYGKQSVLENINLDIMENQMTTLLGKNGSGKSTLLRLIAGAEIPSAGLVLYNDHSISQYDFPLIHDICFVHENIDLIVPYSVEKYISIIKERILNWDDKLFDKMALEREIDLSKNYQEYSRGQKMQVMLMISIASRPKVLLLDEITSVIDVHGRKYFLDLLRTYTDEGHTVVISTNIISELDFYTDNLVIIKNKNIVLNESVSDIPDKFLKIRGGNVEHDIFNDKNCVWAGVNSDRSISYIVPVRLKKKYDIGDDILDKRKSTLEDIFIYYLKRDAFAQEGSDENIT